MDAHFMGSDLFDVAHAAGWEPYDPHDVVQVGGNDAISVCTSTRACPYVFCFVTGPSALVSRVDCVRLSEVDLSVGVSASTAALRRGQRSLLASMCSQPSG